MVCIVWHFLKCGIHTLLVDLYSTSNFTWPLIIFQSSISYCNFFFWTQLWILAFGTVGLAVMCPLSATIVDVLGRPLGNMVDTCQRLSWNTRLTSTSQVKSRFVSGVTGFPKTSIFVFKSDGHRSEFCFDRALDSHQTKCWALNSGHSNIFTCPLCRHVTGVKAVHQHISL